MQKVELSSPPAGEVLWSISWPGRLEFALGHTAFEAHSRVKSAPSFGGCNVKRLSRCNPPRQCISDTQVCRSEIPSSPHCPLCGYGSDTTRSEICSECDGNG